MIIHSLDKDTIKYLAMFTMLGNHIATIFLPPDALLTQALINIGYFTALIMCYFLVEGFHYTHSRPRYAIRLSLFAILSQFPFHLAFATEDILSFYGFNMLFTLLICFAILIMIEWQNPIIKMIGIALLSALTLFCDWPLMAPLFTLLFAWSKQDKHKTSIAIILCVLAFGVFTFALNSVYYPFTQNLLITMGNAIGIILGGIVIRFLYSGKKSKHSAFSKWFFYFFYPIHLLVLGLLRIILIP